MFGRAWKIGSIGGVAIRVDSSWSIIAILITYSLDVRFTDAGVPGAKAFALAFLASVLFFASVLIHELAHAGMARMRGIPVQGIVLYLFGGATSARVEEKGPGAEFLVTVVGPASSLALGGIFWELARAFDDPLSLAFDYVAGVNIVLGLFNLVPGFPLDGGRILRAGIWRVTGSLERATAIAAGVGMVIGLALVAIGIIQAIATGFFFSLWLSMIGWIVFQAARGAVRYQRSSRALSSGVVADAMRAPPLAVPAEISLSQSLDSYLRGREEEVFPVVDDGRVVGVLTFEAARGVGQHDPLRPVRDAMLPVTNALVVGPGEGLDAVAERLDGGEAMVVEDGRLVGTISSSDLHRWLAGHRNFTT